MPTQSEILGFDTRAFANNKIVADESSYFDKVKDFGNGILNVFDRGTEIFSSVTGRISALSQQAKEAFVPSANAVETPTVEPQKDKNGIILETVGTAAVIGVAAYLIFKVLK